MEHMKQKICGIPISKLTLGTVQFGIPYGISNKNGKPNTKTVFEILEYALKNGINSFDTSPAYGRSEKILGSYLNKKKINTIIMTKIPKIGIIDKKLSFSEIYKIAKLSVVHSLKNLNVHKLPICLLHNPNDMFSHNGLVVDALIKMKKEGLISKIGVSTYSPNEVKYFLERKQFDAIQIPISLIDTRLIKNGLLSELETEKKIIFARSIYLQGLILLSKSSIPNHLKPISKYLDKLYRICSTTNLSILELAFLFVRDLKEISSILVGVESKKQLKKNIEMLYLSPLSDEIRDKILKIGTPTENIIDPSKW